MVVRVEGGFGHVLTRRGPNADANKLRSSAPVYGEAAFASMSNDPRVVSSRTTNSPESLSSDSRPWSRKVLREISVSQSVRESSTLTERSLSMAKVIRLHPSVRENAEPRMSAAALAEYLIFKADQQETVLHNSRFTSPPVVLPHSEAMTAIRSYCADYRRSRATLDNVKAILNVMSADLSIRPKQREEALRCLETIDLF